MCFGIFSWHSRVFADRKSKGSDVCWHSATGFTLGCPDFPGGPEMERPEMGIQETSCWVPKMGTDGPPQEIKQGHGRFTLP